MINISELPANLQYLLAGGTWQAISMGCSGKCTAWKPWTPPNTNSTNYSTSFIKHLNAHLSPLDCYKGNTYSCGKERTYACQHPIRNYLFVVFSNAFGVYCINNH